MRYLSVLLLLVLMAVPAHAGKSKKQVLTAKKYAELRHHYHRLCEEVNYPGTWYIGTTTEEMQKWCRAVAKIMYKSGHLPSKYKRKTVRKKYYKRKYKRKYKKKRKVYRKMKKN